MIDFVWIIKTKFLLVAKVQLVRTSKIKKNQMNIHIFAIKRIIFYRNKELHIMSPFPSLIIISSSLGHEYVSQDAARTQQDQKNRRLNVYFAGRSRIVTPMVEYTWINSIPEFFFLWSYNFISYLFEIMNIMSAICRRSIISEGNLIKYILWCHKILLLS